MTATETYRRGVDYGDCQVCTRPAFTRVDGHWSHRCCDHWATLGWSRCPACQASRQARPRPRKKRS